jgi:hypothetical protein
LHPLLLLALRLIRLRLPFGCIDLLLLLLLR